MIRNNLYNSILLDPNTKGADELFIISGYASATFTRRHINDLLQIPSLKSKINLLIGMPSKRSDHQAFLNLLNTYPQNFEGHYYDSNPGVHCKLYSWFSKKNPSIAFSGSANYSQYGFFEKNQENQMTPDNPLEIFDYYNELLKSSISMRDPSIKQVRSYQLPVSSTSIYPGEIEWVKQDKIVKISLLARDGSVPKKSGLNWGQRIDNLGNQREPNQAYLSIKKDAREEGFLPEKGLTFTMLCDDGNSLDCTVQQDGRKAISTTSNNSILGSYIRKRIGVDSGDLVTTEDLEKYGRTDFLLEKINDETFFFDMSV